MRSSSVEAISKSALKRQIRTRYLPLDDLIRHMARPTFPEESCSMVSDVPSNFPAKDSFDCSGIGSITDEKVRSIDSCCFGSGSKEPGISMEQRWGHWLLTITQEVLRHVGHVINSHTALRERESPERLDSHRHRDGISSLYRQCGYTGQYIHKSIRV